MLFFFYRAFCYLLRGTLSNYTPLVLVQCQYYQRSLLLVDHCKKKGGRKGSPDPDEVPLGTRDWRLEAPPSRVFTWGRVELYLV